MLQTGRPGQADTRLQPAALNFILQQCRTCHSPHRAVAAYCALAADWGLAPAALALRFVLGHPLVASAVVGASDEAQVAELLAAAEAPTLDDALVEAIDAIHRRYPNPTP